MNSEWEEDYGGFLKHMEVRGYSAATRRTYGDLLMSLLEFLDEKGLELKAVGKDDLKAYEWWLLGRKTEATGEPWSVSTRSLHIRAVKMFFRWLESAGRILADPGYVLKEPKRERPLPRALRETEVERLLSTPDTKTREGARARAILEVFYSTGLRLSEMAGLTLEDVNIEEGWVRVNQGKGAKDRVVPLGPRAGQVLKGYLANVRPLYVVGKKEPKALWVSKDGVGLSSQVLRLVVKQYAREAGLSKGVTTHVLRHSFATHLVKHGAPVEAVSAMLGHSRLVMTQRYVAVAAVEVKETHEATHPREKDQALLGAWHTQGGTSACGLGAEEAV